MMLGAVAGMAARGVRGVALVALRPPRQPGAVLPGHRGLPDGLRRPAAHLRFPRADRSQIFPYSEPLHIATEPYGPDGLYGKYLTYLLVLMPMGWLAFASIFGSRKAIPAQTPRK